MKITAGYFSTPKVWLRLIILSLSLAASMNGKAQVGFNNPNPDSSSVVDIAATNKGFLIPRVTSVQRSVMKIGPPALANSLMVFDTDSNAFFYYSTAIGDWVYLTAFSKTAVANSPAVLRYGNLGIGVTNPTAKVDISGNVRIADGTEGAGKILTSDATGLASWTTQTFTETDPKVASSSSNKIPKWNGSTLTDGSIIDSAGFVGIGSTSPSAKLNVAGNTSTTNIQITNGAANGYVLKSDATGNASWVNSNTLPITEVDPKVSSSASNKVSKWNGTSLADGTITDSAGFIGIGNTSTNAKLNVAGNTSTTNLQITNGATNGYVLKSDAAGNASWVNSNTLPITEVDPKVSSSASNKVSKWNGTSLTDGTITDSAGFIGIGTTSPTHNLHIAGSVKIADGSQGAGKLFTSDANGVGSWQSPAAAGWGLTGNSGINPSTNFIGTTDNQPIVFRTINSEKVRIDTNGFVGIGIANPLYKLDVNGNFNAAKYYSGGAKVLDNDFATNSLFVGYTGNTANTAIDNTFAGILAGAANSSGTGNTGFGRRALAAMTTGSGNTALGANCLRNSGGGLGNTAVGSIAMESGAAGSWNVAVGYAAMWSMNSGLSNTAVGSSALGAASTTNGSTAVGGDALKFVTTGPFNTAVGYQSSTKLISGGSNSSLGYYALRDNTIGSGNTAMGTSAFMVNTTGSNNTAIGAYAGYYSTTGSNCTFVGAGSGLAQPDSALTNASAIGASATVGASNSMVLGNNVNVGIGISIPTQKLHVAGNIRMEDGNQAAGKILTSDANGVGSWQTPAGTGWGLTGNSGTNPSTNFIGTNDNQSLVFKTNNTERLRLDSLGNFGIGTTSPSSKLHIKGSTNTPQFIIDANGTQSNSNPLIQLRSSSGTTLMTLHSDAPENVFIGTNAGASNVYGGSYVSGYHNTFVGANAAASNTTGSQNSVFGLGAFQSNSTGDANNAFGRLALWKNTTGSNNTAIGVEALISNTTGNGNIAIGTYSLYQNATTSGNTATGVRALENTKADGNTAFGSSSGSFNKTGNYNTFLGYYADATDTNLTNATAIGANATVGSSNSLVLGNSANVGIGTSTPSHKLHVAGTVKIADGTQGNGKILTSDANGVASWQSPAAGGWGLSGNSGTNPSTNFIGTTDNKSVLFKTNNTSRVIIDTVGNVGIGTTSPAALLDVSGDAKVNGISIGRGPGNIGSNTVIGEDASFSNTTGSENTVMGWRASRDNNGSWNTVIGYEALRIGSGSGNTAIGRGALYNVQNSYNTGLGYGTDVLFNNLTNTTAIGAYAAVGANNSLVLGSIAGVNGASASTNVGIGTTTPSARLHIQGTVKIADGTQAVGKILTSDSFGLASWQSPAAGGWGLSGNSGTTTANFIGTTDNISLRFASNNKNYMTLDSIGRLFIGGQSYTGFNYKLNISNDGNTAISALTNYNNIASANPRMQLRRARGTSDAPTAIQSGDWIGAFGMLGFDGTNFFNGASMYSDATENWSAAAHGTNFTITTTPNGTINPIERIRIDHNGYVGIGTLIPTSNLHISDNSWGSIQIDDKDDTASIMLMAPDPTGGGTGGLGTTTNHDFPFFTNNVDRVTIKANGNVGIGTSNPVTKFEVAGGDAQINGVRVGKGYGSQSTMVGDQALLYDSSLGNTAMGYSSLGYNTYGQFNTAVGHNSLSFNTTGEENTAVGQGALMQNKIGNFNTAIGWNALWKTGFYAASTYNVGLGVNAGYNNRSGSNNTFIGTLSDANDTALTNATAIGYNAKVNISNAMVLGSNANVGIGTSAPTHKLHVAGTLKIADGTQGSGKVLTSDSNGVASWQSPAAGGWGLSGNSGTTTSNFLGTTDNISLRFRTNNSEFMTLDSIGRLFMGSQSFTGVNYKLNISNNGTTAISALTNYSNIASANPRMQLRRARGTSDAPTAIQSGDYIGAFGMLGFDGTNFFSGASMYSDATENWSAAAHGTNFTITTTPNGTINPIERIRIDNNGYVGIGTSSPSHKLHVAGTVKIEDGTQGNSKVLTSDSNGVASWQSASASTWGLTGNSGTTPSTNFIGTTDNQSLVIKTNSTERMRVDSLGKVGIGTSAPGFPLQVNTGAGEYGITHTAAGVELGTYIDSTAGWIGTKTNHPMYFYTNDGSSQFTLTQSGNAGIGTTTPSYKLEVANGDASVYGIRIGRGGGNLNGNIVMGGLGSTNTGWDNTAIGYEAMLPNTTGNSNTALGSWALRNNTTGNNGTALGLDALKSNTTGSDNCAAGAYSMYTNTTGYSNAAIGNYSLYHITTGFENSAVGSLALYENTTGGMNSVIGAQALWQNTTGQENIAIGYYAGNGNLTGSQNTYLGGFADATVDGLTNATAVGYNAKVGASNALVLGANANVGIGTSSPTEKLHVNQVTDANKQTIYVNAAQTSTSSDYQNRAVVGLAKGGNFNWGYAFGVSGVADQANSYFATGVYAGLGTTAPSSINSDQALYANGNSIGYAGIFMNGNVGIGSAAPGARLHVATNASTDIARFESTGGTNAYIAFTNTGSTQSPRIGAASNDMVFRTNAVEQARLDVNGNFGIGTTAPSTKLHVKGSSNSTQLIIDANATQSNSNPLFKLRSSAGTDLLSIHSDDPSNIFMGKDAGLNNSTGSGVSNVFIGQSSGKFNTTGSQNLAVGYNSFISNTTGGSNVALGMGTLNTNTTGFWNTAVGHIALSSNTTGFENTGVGFQVLLYNTTGNSNTAVGLMAAQNNTTGNDNVSVGETAGYRNTTGTNNTAIGTRALFQADISSNNTALGYQAGKYISSGGSNTFIGYLSDATDSTLTNATAIGANAAVSASNCMVLGNGVNVGIGISNPTYKLQVNGQPAANGYTAFTNYSDSRLKENITPLEGTLERILKLNPVEFNYNEKSGLDEESRQRKIKGFIAQEVKELFPDMVGTTLINGTEYFDLNLSHLLPYMVKAVQQMNDENQKLKAEVEQLKLQNQELSAMKNDIEELKKILGTSAMNK